MKKSIQLKKKELASFDTLIAGLQKSKNEMEVKLEELDDALPDSVLGENDEDLMEVEVSHSCFYIITSKREAVLLSHGLLGDSRKH